MLKLFCLLITLCFIIKGLHGLYYYDNNKKYITILAFGLGIIAFFTIPNETDDLQRHFNVINEFKLLPIQSIFYSGYIPNYINNLIMFIVSKTGIPNLYTMLLTFIGYKILFLFVNDVYNKYNINNKKNLILIIIFIFSMSFYRMYILALRNYFCFISGVYILYLLQERRISILKSLFLYSLLTFIHPVSLIFIIYIVYINVKLVYKFLITIVMVLHRFFYRFFCSYCLKIIFFI